MRHFNIFLIIFSVIFSTSASPLSDKSYNKGINITPKPLSLTQKDGYFLLTSQTVISYLSPELKQTAEYLSDKMSVSTGFSVLTFGTSQGNNNSQIVLSLEKLQSTNEEAYVLDVSSSIITIKGNSPNGVFYGIQTLLQLLPAEIESKQKVQNTEWKISCVNIQDEPRFKWRGLLLDICRHFFPADFIKKQIDALAMYKINTLHLHLTDDQGWRIEVKKYPRLTQIGAYRTEFDGSIYGGFLTQEEIKDIVRYARERQITIVPEIEIPGHAKAALAAHPELSCNGGPFTVRTHWGVENDVYCAGKEQTFDFLENVFDEIIPLFPGEYIHIGGDECPKVRWNACPDCKKRMDSEKLQNAEELQSYFVRRIEKIVNKHGKKIIGWDEILEGGIEPSAAIMSWRGEKGGIAAAEMNHEVVMTPGNWLYIDYYQGDRKIEPVAIGGYTPLKKVYDYEPVPASLPLSKQKFILGAQANMWTEYVPTADLVEYRIYPRILALSELTWTAKELKNYTDFESRLHNQLVRLDQHKVSYHIPQPEQPYGSINKVAFVDSAKITFQTSRPLPMLYTLDGSEPNITSYVYSEPLKFNKTSILKIRTLLPSGVMSKTRTISVEKQTYLQPVHVKNVRPGLRGKKAQGRFSSVAELNRKVKWQKNDVKSLKDIQVVSGGDNLTEDMFFALELEGYIYIPADNVYYFSTDIDQFWLANQLIINNEGELKRFSRHDTSVALKKGYHPIKLVYLSNIYKGWLSPRRELNIQYKSKDENTFKNIGDNMLFY